MGIMRMLGLEEPKRRQSAAARAKRRAESEVRGATSLEDYQAAIAMYEKARTLADKASARKDVLDAITRYQQATKGGRKRGKVPPGGERWIRMTARDDERSLRTGRTSAPKRRRRKAKDGAATKPRTARKPKES
jgi:hypothetical protein